jgi:hypothetical protein
MNRFTLPLYLVPDSPFDIMNLAELFQNEKMGIGHVLSTNPSSSPISLSKNGPTS